MQNYQLAMKNFSAAIFVKSIRQAQFERTGWERNPAHREAWMVKRNASDSKERNPTHCEAWMVKRNASIF